MAIFGSLMFLRMLTGLPIKRLIVWESPGHDHVRCGRSAPRPRVKDGRQMTLYSTMYNRSGASTQSGWKKGADVRVVRKDCGKQIADVPPLTGTT